VDAAQRTAYLERIGYTGEAKPTAETLAELQVTHLLHVPFENLSIHTGEWIQLRTDWLWDKIVRRRRGGFCYELNGLFAELLEDLGFRVLRLAANVCSEKPRQDVPFDHMCLLVQADDEPWLVDVGFGDNFVRPLRFEERGEQSDGRRAFRIEPSGAEYILWDAGERSFRFMVRPYALADFEPGRRHHTSSPESSFTQGRVVSLLTAEGRVTLRDDRLIETVGAEKHERPLTDPDEFCRLATELFEL